MGPGLGSRRPSGNGSARADLSLGTILADIERRLGSVPMFFEPALANPDVLRELWRQTRVGWLDSPVPAPFRLALVRALAQLSPWPWRAVAKDAAPGDAPLPADLEKLVEGPLEQVQAATVEATDEWPEPGTPACDELLVLAVRVVLEGPRDDVRRRLHQLLGPRRNAELISVFTYLQTWSMFAQAHPGLAAAARAHYRRRRDPVRLVMIETDAAGVISTFSPAAEDLFARSAASAIGRSLTDLFAEESRDAIVRVIDDYAASGDQGLREQSLIARARSEGGDLEVSLTLANRRRDGEPGAMTAFLDTLPTGSQAEYVLDQISTQPAREAGRLAFDAAPVGMALLGIQPDGDVAIIEVNRALCNQFQREPDEVVGLSLDQLTESGESALDKSLVEQLTAGKLPSYVVCKLFRRADGTSFWGDLHVSMIRREAAGEPLYLVVQLVDVDDRKRAEDALHDTRERMVSVFDEAPIGMAVATLDGRWVQVNAAICATFGYDEAELLTKPMRELIAAEDYEPVQRYLDQLFGGEVMGYHMETRAVRADGEQIWIQLSVSLVHDYRGEPAYFLAEVQDVSERKRVEEELEAGALREASTGLPSRALLFDRLEQALSRLARTGTPFLVLFVLVERLETVAEVLGRERAEATLREIGARLVGAVRSGDTVGHYGPSEFVLICEDLESETEVDAIARRVVELGQLAVTEGSVVLGLDVAVGVTIAAEASDTPAALVERADAAMQLAKKRRVGYQEYLPTA